jgi:hypothetical protein
MKRIALFAVLLSFVVAGAAFVSAEESQHGSTKLTIEPSQMTDGETKTLVDGDKTITVKKSGDSVDIKIEGAGKTRTITLNNSGGNISIFKGGDGMAYKMMPAMPKVLIDREIAGAMPRFEQMERAQTWFVCPKDHTMLRVPEGKADQSWKCPVDGTEMEKKKGRGFALFFDHEDHL